MSVPSEIAAARDDIQRARDNLSDTVAEIQERVTAPVQAVKQRLDVGRMVQSHPWAAVAVALGAGAVVASSGADERAASVAVATARQGGVVAARLAREAPARSRGAVAAAVDALGARLALALIDALRAPRVAPLSPESQVGLGFVEHSAPAHEPASPGPDSREAPGPLP